MCRVSFPLQPVTDLIEGFVPELVERRDCMPSAATKPKVFGSIKRRTIGMGVSCKNFTPTSEARPLRTIFSISVVIIPLASLMNDSYDSTTLMERIDIEVPSGDETVCPFSSWFSGALSRLPIGNIQTRSPRRPHRTHRVPRCSTPPWQWRALSRSRCPSRGAPLRLPAPRSEACLHHS